jgi:hypothetical protein
VSSKAKIAQTTTVEYPSVGIPGVFLCTVHPGVVDTGMLESIEVSEDAVHWRDGMRVRSLSVWDLSTGFGANLSVRFLGGEMGWVNRVVEEPKARVEEVRGVLMFTIGIDEWAFRTLSGS